MALIDKLNAIGDAIRGKTGKSAKLTLDQMPLEIAGIAAGGGGADNNQIASILDGTITEFEDSSVKTITITVFGGCTKLAYVSMPNLTLINAAGAFNGCSGLRRVNFPKLQVCGSKTNNNWSANFQNTGIEQLYLPEVTHIGRNEFGGCTKLEIVDLPKCYHLWGDAFSGCSTLKTVILRKDSVCSMYNGTVFNGTPIATGTGYIYVPSALVDSYKAATNWSTFAAQIRAIEDYPEICGEVSP